MPSDSTTDRATLLKAAMLVKPALADKHYILALAHLNFDDEWVAAYNDKLAIAVRCHTPFQSLIPGMMFINGLSAFGGKDVVVHRSDDGSILLKSGRSRVTLPTMPTSEFPLRWPEHRDIVGHVELTLDMLRAIDRCLISVNTDATQPAQLGVTLDVTAKGEAVFFSTDNATVSRAQTASQIELPGGVPVIMPRPFCEQLVALQKAFPDCTATMGIGSGFLDVEYSAGGEHMDARLFTRMPVDLDPLAFPKIIQRHCGDLATLHKRTVVIPDELDSALARALLVLGMEQKKRATAKVDDGVLKLHARSDFGDSEDSMRIELDDVGPVSMDAAMVARGLKVAQRIGITSTVVILASDAHFDFVHMVAHVREGAK